MKPFLIIVSILFGIARFVVPVSGQINQADIFKDMAHLWIGFVFGNAIGTKTNDSQVLTTRQVALIVGLALTVLEVVAFFVRKT